MNFPGLQQAGPLAIDINQPGSFLHWSIFTVSVANRCRAEALTQLRRSGSPS